ncbi:phosphoenolpyruvate synthase/pyruvate phosphate dikinase [Pleurocapsa sp. PCC 7327]|uniref:glycerol-3-phosphate acyltransferase n=1 Tax=Pleurocapsa sp. PCC 7327 TaxID=118163 RepID=UPI00029FA8AA|nr:glycerol-3-phosphate acyltransferase [Pleurocapsa sp. PCC 7327]AFY76297.1 phosphoenolpyruvate synthase/pyruvate phosphate dikinase [Pleurocapsa sp. PCC 7327]
MTLTQLWGSLLIFIACPLLGGLPLIDWITYGLTGRKLARLGTGNISVSAAFYHGGTVVGILAVLSEAAKGIAAVFLARWFFPSQPVWELIALIALVAGRYWMGKGAGTTNVFWGIVAHDWKAALLTVLIGGISFTIFRERKSGRLVGLFVLALILALRHPNSSEYIAAAIALVGLLAWIYQKIPDDLDLPSRSAKAGSRKLFRFFQGDRAIPSLNDKLDARKVGQKAATLSRLKRLGYDVPDGWVLPPGDDPQPLLAFLEPSVENPLVVRSSAIGEDSETASAAGQYITILNVTSREALQAAILDCQTSYSLPSAVRYRQDRNQTNAAMAVLIQKQVRGVFSGVAFSRDPINPLNTAVVIEALPGDAARVVSGKVTPERYYIEVGANGSSPGQNSENGDVPRELLQLVAQITREIEDLYHGIPQDIEWTFDGQQLWLLQARSITNLHPIWTRKIAAEVIPGVIRPLTWSLNRPLTCGVWGEIFRIVLGKRSRGLDFNETATLHYQRAYFNATLLGEIFRRMGLPSESLEFLTRGAKFSKPPLESTLRNLPGLLRLLEREWNLERDFERDKYRYFTPTFNLIQAIPLSESSLSELWERIDTILPVLKQATYYSILAPLSLALRQAIFKVSPEQLDNSQTPEVASSRSLADLAVYARNLLPIEQLSGYSCPSLFAYLAETPDGQNILEQFKQWLERYGYLSEVATDIAVPRWIEDPRPMRALFTRFLFHPPQPKENAVQTQAWKVQLVQKRLNLKGQATEIYSQLLAHLRWTFVALEEFWLKDGTLSAQGDIFFLEFDEIHRFIENSAPELRERLPQLIQQRRTQYKKNQAITHVPFVVYGSPKTSFLSAAPLPAKGRLQGIAASPGIAEGQVKILRTLQQIGEIDPQTILVVPYTDSGWTAILARAGGIIAEVGGALSHGAIVAREYGIPAVMDIYNATHLLRDGQRVRVDGQMGVVEILED